MSALPSGWEVVAIGDVTLPKVPQGAPEGDSTFTYVDISSVDNAAKRIAGARPIVGKDAPSRARQHLAPNDVLVSMTRPNLNAVAKVPAEFDGAIGSTGFDVLRCQEIEPDWIFYTVRSPAFVQAMSDLVQGALYPAVRSEDVRSYQIPLPPRNEQRRIVAKLDALFEKSRSTREKLDRLPRLLANLQKSVLNSAFRGDLTEEWRAKNPNVEPASELLKRIRAERRAKWEADLIAKGKDPKKAKYVEPEPVDAEGLPELPEGWCWVSCEQICWLITDGEHQTPLRTNDGVPLISARNVLNGELSLKHVDFISEATYEQLSRRVRPDAGDVLLSCSGTVGRSCVVPPGAKFAMVRSTAILKPVLGFGDYLSFALRSPSVQTLIDAEKTQTAQSNLFQGKIKKLVIPLAPEREAIEIVRAVHAGLSQVDRVSNVVLRVTDRQEGLNSSLLSKAFRGELIPQDPNDEPASVLLERIRAQKPAAGTKRGRGRKAAA